MQSCHDHGEDITVTAGPIVPFRHTLATRGLELGRATTCTLQINVGRLCDLTCRHCHLEAGPERGEVMSRATMEDIIALAGRARFSEIDITGGSPELVPDIKYLLGRLATCTDRLIVRTNLVALHDADRGGLAGFYRDSGVVLAASLPSGNAAQTEAQRGQGVWDKSLAALKRLNSLGYGVAGGSLELILVSNPAGAFLPGKQEQMERKLRQDLARHGIVFSRLVVLANAPLGRFRHWLEHSGNLEAYMHELAARFNPLAMQGAMCRTLISVDWDGIMYDCDFNLAAGIPLGGERRHVSALDCLPAEGAAIACDDHCYTCMASSGFT